MVPRTNNAIAWLDLSIQFSSWLHYRSLCPSVRWFSILFSASSLPPVLHAHRYENNLYQIFLLLEIRISECLACIYLKCLWGSMTMIEWWHSIQGQWIRAGQDPVLSLVSPRCNRIDLANRRGSTWFSLLRNLLCEFTQGLGASHLNSLSVQYCVHASQHSLVSVVNNLL